MDEPFTGSEPTTGIYRVIAQALRESAQEAERQGEQNFHCSIALILDTAESFDQAADRLERQEHQIKQLSEALAQGNEWHKESVEIATNNMLEYVRELSGIAGELERMTARAEQAEKERDATIDLTAIRIMRYIIENDVEIGEWNEPCELCEHHYSTHGKCGNCYSTENFELRKDCRGLPEDGEGL